MSAAELKPTRAGGEGEPVTTLAAFAKSDGRTVMVCETGRAELVLLVERTAGQNDWHMALGPFGWGDIAAHADAVVVGDSKALTDPAGHRVVAMALVALIGKADMAQREALSAAAQSEPAGEVA
jgi:hypothetical protein